MPRSRRRWSQPARSRSTAALLPGEGARPSRSKAAASRSAAAASRATPATQAAFRASPELDGDTLALAAGLVDEMQLGRGPAPDVLAISLSATDYVGHTYGTEGQEMCLQLLALDRELGDFLAVLDSRGIDYAVVLTADHGGKDIPERKRLAGVADAARVDPGAGRRRRSGQGSSAQLGLTGPGLYRRERVRRHLYRPHAVAGATGSGCSTAAVAAYRAHPQVEAVFTADELAATPVPTGPPDEWTPDPARPGELLSPAARATSSSCSSATSRRSPTPRRYVATHGSPWDYDRRVPMLFWRKGMAAAPSDAAVETVDIMPTLAAMARASGRSPDRSTAIASRRASCSVTCPRLTR